MPPSFAELGVRLLDAGCPHRTQDLEKRARSSSTRARTSRDECDVLKAILHNAARSGPAAQNRAGVTNFRAHLLGRIAWVTSLNAGRGGKLQRRFERIAWGP